MKYWYATALAVAVATPSVVQAQSRDVMMNYIMRHTYERSCRSGASISADIAKLPLSECIDLLVRTRGPSLLERAKQFPDSEVRKLYLEYGGK